MSPVQEAIAGHRSIRKYRPEPVSEKVLERVLGAGLRASSSGNMQTWSVIVTSDPAIRAELLDPHFGQEMVVEAPHLLTFCADFRRMRHWLRLSVAPDGFDDFMSFMIAAIDAVLASQNVALAAESEGLGICYLGTTLASSDRIAGILGMPQGVAPVVGFVLGHPAEDPPARDRLPLSGLVHRERYQDPGDAEIRATYSDREKRGWERYMANPELRAKIEASGVKNLAQIYSRLKYTRESHRKYSRNVLRCLESQGFGIKLN